MLNAEQIKKTEEFLRRKLDAGAYLNAHSEAKAYRLAHSYRVANIGLQIARKEGFDETEMAIACLLHDVSYCEEFGETGWREHGRRSARIARPFLESLGLPHERIDDICYGIAIHVDDKADFPGERTPFALTVADADNLDRLDAYRIHETLCHDRFLELDDEKRRTLLEKRLQTLRELWDLPTGTKTAEALWHERLSFSVTFYEKLLRQLEQSGGIV